MEGEQRLYLPPTRSLPQQAQRQFRRFDVREFGLALVLLAMLGLVSLLYLTLASQIATLEFDIERMNDELHSLQVRNSQLAAEIALKEGITNVRKEAQEMGLTEDVPTEFLPVSDFPLEEEIVIDVMPSYLQQEDKPVPEESKSLLDSLWWKQLVSQFAAWVTSRP